MKGIRRALSIALAVLLWISPVLAGDPRHSPPPAPAGNVRVDVDAKAKAEAEAKSRADSTATANQGPVTVTTWSVEDVPCVIARMIARGVAFGV